MAEYFGIKVEDIFNTMKDRFRPEGAKDIDAVIGYEIKSEGKWKLCVNDGKMELSKVDDLSGCGVVTITDGQTFVGVNIGKIDPMTAFSSGALKIDGDMGLMSKTGKIFRKYAPPVKELSTREMILDMFGTLEKRFQPKNATGLNVTIGYDITGEDGGKWMAVVKDGKCSLKNTIEGEPSVKLCVESRDWVALMLGKTEAASLLGAGRATITGDFQLALKLGEIFSKYISPADAGKEPEQELLVHKTTISVDQKFSTGPMMGKFLNALKNKKIIGNKCPKCGRIQLPPRETCAECRVRADEWVEVGPKGQLRLLEYVYYASPDPLTGETRETPYGAVIILLDGCSGNDTFWHLIRRDQIDKVQMGWNERAGSRLRPVWNEKRTGSIFDIKYFEIDE
jgi:uncharacterized OB-fold protein/putative sterol carrier protein